MDYKLCYLWKKLAVKYGVLSPIFRHYMESIYIVYPNFSDDYRNTLRIHNNVRSRVKRRNTYITGMIDTYCRSSYRNLYLASFTFTDEVLQNTSSTTRKKYISDFLKENCIDYFACIDFGKKKQREHYHALIVTDNPTSVSHISKQGKIFYNFATLIYPYGFHSLRKVDLGDGVKAGRYAFKAGGYAFKSSDSEHKAFHARKVYHMQPIPYDDSVDF